jgi:hypothetical protein
LDFWRRFGGVATGVFEDSENRLGTAGGSRAGALVGGASNCAGSCFRGTTFRRTSFCSLDCVLIEGRKEESRRRRDGLEGVESESMLAC